jgi:hypothetical protein
VSRSEEACRHVGAHAPQTDEAELKTISAAVSHCCRPRNG